ncbi:MAG: putative transposase DNA-binding domain protein [Methanoregula sp. PtaU1.Bin051]|nr:MAG: putative transposase DNA-binding domain protein [Methanoregula sp. PtaU1.Bin051]
MTERWIGVDLNTTGPVAVAADPASGKVMKLGSNTRYVRSHSVKNCTKLYKTQKLWKLKKIKSRERTLFRNTLHAIGRQIVSFADALGSGIKFEKLFNSRSYILQESRNYAEFSFDNGSFYYLQKVVERKARKLGIPVIYVNPAFTSKRCSRCGRFGRRYRKRFECPHCGYVVHADVNAAFNIASAQWRADMQEGLLAALRNQTTLTKKQIRRLQRSQAGIPSRSAGRTGQECPSGNLLYCLECHQSMMQCTPS